MAHLSAQELPSDTGAARAAAGETVRLLTAHASKGLEWDLVCIAGVQEGVWPNLSERSSLLGAEVLVERAAGIDGAVVDRRTLALAEERRLFYVAVTRARRGWSSPRCRAPSTAPTPGPPPPASSTSSSRRRRTAGRSPSCRAP